jgi:outer membrane protein insertion porin family
LRHAVLAALLSAAAAGATAGTALHVHSVRIEGSTDEQEQLARYVELKPGDPVDADRLRHAVELIYATGRYEDVRVESTDTADGLDLVVRPVPGPLMTGVRILGDAVIDANDVRRVARLHDGEPLWPERLEAAAQALALHLADVGYLEALVTPETRPSPGAAIATFRVRAGPLARVSDSAVTSPRLASTLETLRRPRHGEVWRRGKAREEAEAMRRFLVRRGYWRAKVELEDPYDPATGTVNVQLRVDPGPELNVRIVGAPSLAARRGAVTSLLRENAARGDAVDQAVDQLEEALRRQGHRTARVRWHEETAAEGTAVVFEAQPGPRTIASTVRVDSAVEMPSPALLTRVGEPVRDRDLEEDERTLTRLLQERGHADARVEADVPERTGDVPVVFRVKPGPRTEVASVNVRSAVSLRGLVVDRDLRNHTGGAYHVRDVVADRNALVTAYRNAGYLAAEVRSGLQFSDDRTRVDVSFLVEPGPLTRVDHIVITGLQHTHEDIVRRELRLHEGDPLGLEAVLESQRRLGALGIFGNASITEIDPESTELRSLRVSVEERPLTSLAYSFGYSEQDRTRLSAEVTRRNLGGRDRSLSLFASGSLRGLRLYATYREPYLLGKRQEIFLTGFREYEERESFKFNRYGLLLQTARRLSRFWSWIARYQAQQTRSFDVHVSLDQIDRTFLNATFSGPSTSVVYDTRDDPLDPHKGAFLDLDAQLSARVLGGESFMKAFVQGSLYRRLLPHLMVAVSGRVGLARTFGAGEPLRLPLPDRFFAGGDYSLRGFELDHAGPLELSTPDPSVPDSGNVLLPTGGNALLLGSVELRQDLGRYFGLALFSDIGNVYPLARDVTLDDLRYAAGLGLRYRSAFGPIRVDWGYKLNRRPGESASRLHFAIGHAF